MNKEKQIIPVLRFPEFRGEWNGNILEKLCFKISDGIHSTPNYDDTGEYYFVNGNNLVNGKIVTNELTKKVSKEEFEKHKRELGSNTILLSINGTIGNLSEYNNEKVVLGKSACYINVDKDKADKKFVLYSLKTEGIRNYFYSELTGSTIKNLSLKTIKNTIIKLPEPEEQQKIANSLSSLDNIISAETEKLNHLKEHKKGLLQQLFPAEGETQPQFRFPEFNDEWCIKSLSKCADVIDPHPSHRAPAAISNGIPFIGIGDISVNGELDTKNVRLVSNEIYDEHTDRYQLKTGDFAYGRVASVGKVVDLSNNVDKIYTYSPTMAIIQPKSIYPRYLKFFCESNFFVTQVKSKISGSTRKSIGMQNLRILKIAFPLTPKEQQKIAKCLSSVDELIEVQSQKIKTLQEHKTGLMQQLFPNANDVAL